MATGLGPTGHADLSYLFTILVLIYCSRQDAEGLIKRYFDQVTEGCGQQQCDNEFCASGKLRSSSNKDEAAALALRLLLKGARLCPLQGKSSHFQGMFGGIPCFIPMIFEFIK